MRRVLHIGLELAALVLFLLAAAAFGQEHGHPPQDLEIHEKFYSNWMRPDNPTSSCCSLHDCYPTEYKRYGDTWFFKHRETGEWRVIHSEKMENFRPDQENARESPDGRNHVCASPYNQVYCGVLGTGI
jgi:hypothetical protein